jgi:hypothetical protein
MDNNIIKKAREKQSKSLKKCNQLIKTINGTKRCSSNAVVGTEHCNKHLSEEDIIKINDLRENPIDNLRVYTEKNDNQDKHIHCHSNCPDNCNDETADVKLKTKINKKEKQSKIINKCAGTVKNKTGTHQCTYEPLENEDYCGKHLLTAQRLQQAAETNSKLCSKNKNNKNCEIFIPNDSKYSTCSICRENDKTKTHDIKTIKTQRNLAIINNPSIEVKIIECTYCPIKFEYGTVITGKGEPSQKCSKCFKISQINEKNRADRDRDYALYDAQPHVKQRKKEYRKNNPEKMAIYWMSYRQRQINKLGLTQYRKLRADYKKKYLNDNPDKRNAIYHKQNTSICRKYNYYKREALLKGRKFELTQHQCTNYFLANCFYCNKQAIEGELLNGIDRKNNDIGYITDNCVTACTLCNMIKGSFSDDEKFIFMCNHILTYLGIVTGNTFYDAIDDSRSGPFIKYLHSAKKRGYTFELDEHNFITIKSNPCYLCGKQNSDTHQNGIDRIDNNIGYILSNSKSCCKTCNFMKSNYSLHDFLTTLLNIYQIHFKDNNILVTVDEVCDKLCNLKYKNIHPNKKNKIIIDEDNDEDSSGCISDDSFSFEKHLDEEVINIELNKLEQNISTQKLSLINNTDTNIIEKPKLPVLKNTQIGNTNKNTIDKSKVSIGTIKKMNMTKNQLERKNNQENIDSDMIKSYTDDSIAQRAKNNSEKKQKNEQK